MAVTDAALVAHIADGRGVRRRRGDDQPARGADRGRAAAQVPTRSFVGAVLNRVDLEHNAYYYSQYYRREYGDYYVKTA